MDRSHAAHSLEAAAQQGLEIGFRAPPHRQPAAPLRPLGPEGREDHVAPGCDGALELPDVGGAILVLSEEVECGAVMPRALSDQI